MLLLLLLMLLVLQLLHLRVKRHKRPPQREPVTPPAGLPQQQLLLVGAQYGLGILQVVQHCLYCRPVMTLLSQRM